ncbi:MAG: hypothetical protein FWF02_00450 [Micrococcales bacterium]|nr:hypothetical protein [Micrococcales bacterium]MCL2666169.1 hypothetical protein [Micrococcales bacterium]
MMTHQVDDEHTARRLRALAQWQPTSSVEPTAVLRTGRRHRRAQIGGLATVAAVMVVAVAVTVAASGGRSGTSLADGSTTTVAAPVVSQARAAMAAAAPDPAGALDESTWVGAPYWYVKKRVHGTPDTPEIPQAHVVETWMAHRDTSLRIVDGDQTTAYGQGPGGWVLDDYDPTTGAAWDVLFALPTDPVALEAELRRAVVAAQARYGSVDDMVWGLVKAIYPETPASSALRAALWQVAEGLEGTTVTVGVVDSEGRTGTAISRLVVLESSTSQVPEAGGSDTVVLAATETLVVDPDDFTVLEVTTATPDALDVLTVTYLAMGPAWRLPVEPTLGDPTWPSLLQPGCVFWETC